MHGVDKRRSRLLRKKDRAYMLSVPTHLVRELGWEAGDEISMGSVSGVLVAKRQKSVLSEGDAGAVEDYLAQARRAIQKTVRGAEEEKKEPVDRLDSGAPPAKEPDFDPLDRLEFK